MENTGGGINADECTATPDKVLAPYTFGGAGSDEVQKGTIPSKEAENIMPGKNNVVIPGGQYLAGDQVIYGDPSLSPEHIKKGVIIFGVTGTYEGYYIGSSDIYNRGTWGNGFGNSFIRALKVNSAQSQMKKISYEQQSIHLYDSPRTATGCGSTTLIDFTPWNKLNVLVSHPDSTNQVYLYAYGSIPSYALDAGSLSRVGPVDVGTSEKLLSFDISNIKQKCAFSLYSGNESIGGIYIHKIYFT